MKKALICLSFSAVLVGIIWRSAVVDLRCEEVAPVMAESDIYSELKAFMVESEFDPIEPRLDPVFEFVPGLYGLAVDFELSYQNMLSHGQFDPNLIAGEAVPYEGNPEDFRQHRIYKGNEHSPYVGLLINVAWGSEELDEILDILDEHNVLASIFFEGKFADNHHEQVRDVLSRGHLIGNHSYSHPADWLSFSYDEFQEEIVLTNDILRSITGEEVIYFAPPGGAFTEDTIRAAYDQGMYTILWSADSIDWRGEPAHVLVERVMTRLEPGGLILTHPKPETVRALPEIIDRVRGEGLEFRRVDDIVHGRRGG